MYSMYETLMNLPLFKGASKEQIHAFAEKTHLSFMRHAAGETFIEGHKHCNSVICLLSGRVSLERKLFGGALTVSEEIESGSVIGCEHLFGLDTRFGFDARAVEDCGLMSFPKKQYISLLQDNHIFLINYLNILALRGHNCDIALQESRLVSDVSQLGFLVELATSREASKIRIESHGKSIVDLLHINLKEEDSQFSEMLHNGVIRILSPNVMEIPSRRLMLNLLRLKS